MRAETMAAGVRRLLMRIGVNALYLIPGGVGGTEIYLRSLLDALAEIDRGNQYFVFTNRETGAGLAPKAANFTTVAAAGARRVASVRASFGSRPRCRSRPSRLRLDVMLNPGFTAPLACPCPQVTVFHDLQHKRHPEYFRWFDLPFWSFFLFWTAHVSRLMMAVSDATAADLRQFYRLPESKIRVVPLGVDPVFFDVARRRGPEPFLLAVSTLHPHKNLDGLLRAFAMFRREHPEFRLVVCGMHGFFTGPLHDLAEQLGLSRCRRVPGLDSARGSVRPVRARVGVSSTHRVRRASGCRCWRRWPRACPTACSDIEPLRRSRAMRRFGSIPAILHAIARRWAGWWTTQSCGPGWRTRVRGARRSSRGRSRPRASYGRSSKLVAANAAN